MCRRAAHHRHFLERNNSAAAVAAVRRDHGNRAAVSDPIANAVRAESTEDDRVHRADPGAGEHGDGRFGNRRQIDDDAVALVDLVSLQDIGEAANFVMKLLVSERPFLARLALPDDGRFVSSRAGQMSIQTVFRNIDFPPTNHLAKGAFHCRTFFQGARQTNSCASRAQNFAG